MVFLTTITITNAVSHCHCDNGGECIYDSFGFKYCKCPRGFTGRYCQEVNECSHSNPCQNGARCINSNGRNHCVCVNGWTGPDCSINIDDCASNPCSSGAKRCHDGIGSFSCECEKGYTGLLCQLRDGCASNPCHANATCYANPTNGSAMCSCPSGYKSDDCSVDINECEEMGSPCEHGGVCVNTEGSFKCDCLLGFTGSRCEININECYGNPCLNEGTCLDEIGGYRCICAPGYTGNQCEIDIDECIVNGNPCMNGGVCTNLINGYRCLCPNGFNGTRCESNINECSENQCINGQCIDGIGQYTCLCSPGYTGHNCQINIDECASSPCINGQCIDGINSYTCICQPGFTGPNCQTNINECHSNPCYHGGICHDLINGYKCECPLGTSGIRCEYNTNECYSNPCRNSALCHDKINGYECECAPGFTGLNCEIDIDNCQSSPCANGGKCHDLPNGFKCTCPKGYFDARCMSDVDECKENPCLNGGQCEDDINKYICHCLPGFTGPRCELEVDACASSPCQHNGVCMNFKGNYKCTCAAGFTGKSCEINISDCNASLFGDCLLGYNVNPWINCTHSTFCWKAFSDGVCNEVCNTKECLFDGMDCLYKQKNSGSNNQYVIDKENSNQDIRLNGKRRQCDPEFDSYCQRNYQNGFCDQGCNNEQCGWDGLDCLEINQKNNLKQQINYSDLPYVAKGSLLITLNLPFNKILMNDLNNLQKAIASNSNSASIGKTDDRPIFAILRQLSQIVGTTLRVKQDYNDGNFILRPSRSENGENLTEIEVIADNRMCEYDCFDSATQIANYLAAFQARTNELSHQFGQNNKFSLKSIRALEEAESLKSFKIPKDKTDSFSITTWVCTCLVVIFIGLMLGVLIANKDKKTSVRGITWFPEGFRPKPDSCRSISAYQAAGGEYMRSRNPLNRLKGFNKMDRKPDGQEMTKAWLQNDTICENKELNANSHVIYEEPKDPRSWSTQHYEAYGDSKNPNTNGILMPLPIHSSLQQVLHPGLIQTQNINNQTRANTEVLNHNIPPYGNGLLSPPLDKVNCVSGDVDVVGPSGFTPLMIASAFRGVTPYCGIGGEDTLNNNKMDSNDPMDTHNGPGSAGSAKNEKSSTSMIDDLISQGASIDKTMENTGETSLHLAARFCRADAVKRLLEANADCNSKDFDGRTPLHTAIAADACGAFQILINHRHTDLNAKSKNGDTPLILAVRSCADSMMKELLNLNIEINLGDNVQRTALHWAALVSNLTALKELIKKGANKDAQDEKEQTPLFLAAREGSYECVKILLEAGANKDITDHMDVSPRKIAEIKLHKDIVTLLDSNIQVTNNNSENVNPNSPANVNSPKKPSNNENTNTAKRQRKAPKQTKPIQQTVQQQQKSNQSVQQTNVQQQNYDSTNCDNQSQMNSNTLKKGQSIQQLNIIQSSNPQSMLNQQPPPLPPPRPVVQIPNLPNMPNNIQNNNSNNNNVQQQIKIQKTSQIVNLPQIVSNQQMANQQQINYNQNLPSPFDQMIHTPLTPTYHTNTNLQMNYQQITMPNTPNSITAVNSPSNHVLLSPNDTVLMSPPHNQMHHQLPPHHYLGKPPTYEDSISSSNHHFNQQHQQISNATYMTASQLLNATQWSHKPEPNYYTLYNMNQNNDSSYLTPSPDSPGESNWSATSPASNADLLELQSSQHIQQMPTQINQQQQEIVNNQIMQQTQLIDQQQLSPEQIQDQQVNQHPPTYQASCNQPINQNAIQASANARQPTNTQQAVFL